MINETISLPPSTTKDKSKKMASTPPTPITGRSIMVGDAPPLSRQSSHEAGVNGRQSSVNFDNDSEANGSDYLADSRRSSAGPQQIKQSRQQSNLAALRSRERSWEEALAHCVADAGLNAFGCVFVEVWALAEGGTKLIRPDGGHWMDPAFAQSLPNDEFIEKAWELERNARDCPPGAGLAGTLADEAGLGKRYVHWRQIKTLLNDPFVQRGSGKRMERFVELGIGLVAAVPFSFQDRRGIVLYFSRSSANTEMLRSPSNERFLLGSTDLIGSNYAMWHIREESVVIRKNMFQDAIKKVRKELLNEKASLTSVVMNKADMEKLKQQREKEADGEEENAIKSDTFTARMGKRALRFGRVIFRRMNNSRRKWRGAKLHGPPRQSFSDCVFVFTGAFLTMLTIQKIANSLQTGSKFDFDGGWYSSTLCIMYALTPAPVGQPRQIFAAHLWNMLVGMACRQIPDGGFTDFMEGSNYGLPLIWKQALACGLGIVGQGYIGIIHPPATGLATTFTAKHQYSWGTIASVMLTDCVVVVLSMMILNLSEKKQYPLYWLGFGWGGSGGTIGYARSKVRRVKRGAHSINHSIKENLVLSERDSSGADAV